MSYNNDIYKEAHSILEKIRDKNKYIIEERKEEISKNLPEYLKLKKEQMDILGEYISKIGHKDGADKESIKERLVNNDKKRKELLSANGYPEDYLDDIYACSECKDTGYILNKKCICLENLLIKTAFSKSNLNNALVKQNFDNFDINLFSDTKTGDISPRENMIKILKYSKEFIDNFDKSDTKSLLFTGSTGVGKTYLSSCIAKAVIENGNSVLYETASKVVEILENNKFKNQYDTDYSGYNALYDVDLLIIDDLGTEFKTSYTLSAIYELINTRLINGKKIIISTNMSIKELKENYSERLSSRFIGEFLILEFIGKDLRTKEIFDING